MEDVQLRYTISNGTVADKEVMYGILAPVLVSKTKPANGIARDSKRLSNNIDLAIAEDNAVLLRYDNAIVGVQLLQFRKVPIIVHSNILEQHKATIGSALLLDYILNSKYKGVGVFILDVTPEFASIVEPIGGVYRILPKVANTVHTFVKGYADGS